VEEAFAAQRWLWPLKGGSNIGEKGNGGGSTGGPIEEGGRNDSGWNRPLSSGHGRSRMAHGEVAWPFNEGEGWRG
jgi:hypothetical protein